MYIFLFYILFHKELNYKVEYSQEDHTGVIYAARQMLVCILVNQLILFSNIIMQITKNIHKLNKNEYEQNTIVFSSKTDKYSLYSILNYIIFMKNIYYTDLVFFC